MDGTKTVTNNPAFVDEKEENMPVDLVTFMTYTNVVDVLKVEIKARHPHLKPKAFDAAIKASARNVYLTFYTKPQYRKKTRIEVNDLCSPELARRIKLIPNKYAKLAFESGAIKYARSTEQHPPLAANEQQPISNNVTKRVLPEDTTRGQKRYKQMKINFKEKRIHEAGEKVVANEEQVLPLSSPPTVVIHNVSPHPYILPFPTLFEFPMPYNSFKKCIDCKPIVMEMLEVYANEENVDYEVHKENIDLIAKLTMDYYHLFYMYPSIRKKFKFKVLACPANVKTLLLKIPDGSISKLYLKSLKNLCPSLFNFPVSFEHFKGMITNRNTVLQRIAEQHGYDDNAFLKLCSNEQRLEALNLDLYHRFYMQPEIKFMCNFQYVSCTSPKIRTEQKNACIIENSVENERELEEHSLSPQEQEHNVRTIEVNALKTNNKRKMSNAQSATKGPIVKFRTINKFLERSVNNFNTMQQIHQALKSTMIIPFGAVFNPVQTESNQFNYKEITSAGNIAQSKPQLEAQSESQLVPQIETQFERQCQPQLPEKVQIQDVQVLEPNTSPSSNTSISNIEQKLSDSQERIICTTDMINIPISPTDYFATQCNKLLSITNEMFRHNVDKKLKLLYIMRCCDYSQSTLLRTVLNMPLHTFLKHVRVYENSDPFVLHMYYQLAIMNKIIWPLDLYIPIEELLKCVHRKNVKILDLTDIPPMLLHWSDIMHHTDYDDCVRLDYMRKMGTTLPDENLPELREQYYKLCYENNMWVWRAPKLTHTTPATTANQHSVTSNNITTTVNNPTTQTEVETNQLSVNTIEPISLSCDYLQKPNENTSAILGTQHDHSFALNSLQIEPTAYRPSATQLSPSVFPSSSSSCGTIETQVHPNPSNCNDSTFIPVANTQDQIEALNINASVTSDPLLLLNTTNDCVVDNIVDNTVDVATTNTASNINDESLVEVIVKDDPASFLNKLFFVMNDDDDDNDGDDGNNNYECCTIDDAPINISGDDINNSVVDNIVDNTVDVATTNTASNISDESLVEVIVKDDPASFLNKLHFVLNDDDDDGNNYECYTIDDTPIIISGDDSMIGMFHAWNNSDSNSTIANVTPVNSQDAPIVLSDGQRFTSALSDNNVTELQFEKEVQESQTLIATAASPVFAYHPQHPNVTIRKKKPPPLYAEEGTRTTDVVPQLTHTFPQLPFVVESKKSGSTGDVVALPEQPTASQVLSLDNTILNDTNLKHLLEDPFAQRSKSPGCVSASLATAASTNTVNMLHGTSHIVYYRSIQRFRYFEKLTIKHVADYSLPNVGLNKRYMDVQLKCRGRTFNACCQTLVALMPHCNGQLISDIQRILYDLKEFHYARYTPRNERNGDFFASNNVHNPGDDLRKRVLVEFFNSLPPIGLCVIRQNGLLHKEDRVQCEVFSSAQAGDVKPLTPLTRCIKPAILERMRHLKSQINS